MAAWLGIHDESAVGRPGRIERQRVEQPNRGASQNFFRVELASGQRRQLTDLAAGAVIRNFDVSPDGTQIVFDRLRNNTDIVSMNLVR